MAARRSTPRPTLAPPWTTMRMRSGPSPDICWRMVSRGPGYRVDTPTDCPESVKWTGRTMVGRKRMRLWSCAGHVEGLEDLRPVRTP
jgi:hypothetical protein